MPKEDHEIITLGPEQAIALWRKTIDATDGSHPWNEWVTKNPNANIDFYQVDFTKYITKYEYFINFSDFIFPNGNVFFVTLNSLVKLLTLAIQSLVQATFLLLEQTLETVRLVS